jgi:hypothetical protein
MAPPFVNITYSKMFPAVIQESQALAARLGVPLEFPGTKL